MPPIKHNHTWAVKPSERCPACDLKRTGPYRLADGAWSDGVGREYEIAAYRFGVLNPTRMSVNFDDGEGVFAVWKGRDPVREFPTHAEAIAYADRMARTNQGENK